MIGVFAATDVFVFYVMFEVMLIPMYFLIGAYGGVQRAYAATKFFLYSLLGGLMMLAALIGLYVASGDIRPEGGTLDWATLQSIAHQIPESTQLWIFAGFAIAFAIKAPLVPLHTWLPDAGAEAPAGAGTLLVGVLDKVGTFGFLRICLPLAAGRVGQTRLAVDPARRARHRLRRDRGRRPVRPQAVRDVHLDRALRLHRARHLRLHHPVDLRRGVLHGQPRAGHRAAVPTVGMLTARGGSQRIADYGGVWKVAPLLGGVFLIASLATIALPGTNSFVSEFLVLIGSFTRYSAWTIVATVGMVLAAVYMLWIFQRVMTGPVRGAAVLADDTDGEGGQPVPVAVGAPAHTDPDGHEMTHPEPHATTKVRVRFGDLKAREIAVVTPLVLLILFLGVYPKPVLDVINPTSAQTMIDSGHTDPAPALGGGK